MTTSKDSLREYARSLGSEPSEFINTLTAATGKSIWLLTESLEPVWCSINSKEFISSDGLGGCSYLVYPSPVTESIKECVIRGDISPQSLKINGKEYEVVCCPLDKEDLSKGYVVIASEGIRTKLTHILSSITDRQKIRERVCSPVLMTQ